MTGYEVIILIAGIAFLAVSFFLGNKQEGMVELDTSQEIKKIKEAAVFQENELRQKVQNLLDAVKEEVLAETEERLGKISNDKMIAVDEFSGQVLEKIENNNQEVIFLYDMLQKKEEEMKSTMSKMEQTRRENKELFDRLEELKKAKARVNSRNKTQHSEEKAAPAKDAQRVSAEPELKKNTIVEAATKSTVTAFRDVPEQEIAVTAAAENAEGVEEENGKMTQEECREKILALYAEKKSILEISRELSMGQGEVKLIVDLYAGR